MRISDWSSDVCSSDLQNASSTIRYADLAPSANWLTSNRRSAAMMARIPVSAAGRTMPSGERTSSGRRSSTGLGVSTDIGARYSACGAGRAEELRVGTECVRKSMSRRGREHQKKKYNQLTSAEHELH